MLKLIVICGPPCSGKSTLAAELSRRMKTVHLELDAIRARIIPRSSHSEQDRDIAYRAMHLIAENLLGQGHSAILDATYGRARQRSDLQQLCRTMGAKLRLVQCTAPLDIALQRFKDRSGEHFAVDLTPERVSTLVQTYPYDAGAPTVATDDSIEYCLNRIESFVFSARDLTD